MTTVEILIHVAEEIYSGQPLSDAEADEFTKLVWHYAGATGQYPGDVLRDIMRRGWECYAAQETESYHEYADTPA